MAHRSMTRRLTPRSTDTGGHDAVSPRPKVGPVAQPRAWALLALALSAPLPLAAQDGGMVGSSTEAVPVAPAPAIAPAVTAPVTTTGPAPSIAPSTSMPGVPAIGAPAAVLPPIPRPGGPALAPTERSDAAERVGDGTSAATLPRVVRRDVTIDRPTPDEGAAATLLADRVTLDGERNMTASGGVVIWYQGTRLVASEITYDGQTGGVILRGPIHMTDPARAGTADETILIADAAQLDPNMQDGILRGARLVLARELQLAATEARRSDNGRFTVLDQVVASSCHVCASDPTPLWEIRAKRVTHDAVTRQLHFDNPQFRAFGIPIGALPAMTAPDPTVDRMTGFLRPTFRTTSRLGFGIKLPYFITLGDSADLTVTPYVSTSRTRTVELRYRQAFENGVMEWSGALSRDDIEPGDTRGYLFGAARFELPRGYRLTMQVQSASDRQYLLDYDITDADRLWSGVMVDRVRRDRFFFARVGRYESLRDDEDNATTPNRVADIMWHRRWRPALIGGEAGLEWSLHGHKRPSSTDVLGRDAIRGSLSLDWQRSEILPHGFVGALQARADADVYHIRQDSHFDDWFTRIDPVLAAELRWPLIRATGAVTHILEPVLQIVWSPEQDWSDDIPNEDSHLIEFDEGNLFSLDRFPGWDARESGLRANLGLTWTRLDPSGWSLALTAGRVLRSRSDPAFLGSSPLGGRRSDWLVSTQYSHPDGLAIANRALFDDSLHISRNDFRLGWLRNDLQLSAGYLWMDSDALENRDDDVSELTANADWQISSHWWGAAELRYDFSADRAQKALVGLQYRNECLTVDMAVKRRFTSSGDLKPETSLDLGIRLSGFGSQKDGRGTVARNTCLR